MMTINWDSNNSSQKGLGELHAAMMLSLKLAWSTGKKNALLELRYAMLQE